MTVTNNTGSEVAVNVDLITVEIDGKTVRVGSARFMKMEGISLPSEVQQALDAAHDEGFSLVIRQCGHHRERLPVNQCSIGSRSCGRGRCGRIRC